MPVLGAHIFSAQSEEVLPIGCSNNVHVLTTKQKVNVYLPSLMMKVPDHLYV
jgi:hypothetical protein